MIEVELPDGSIAEFPDGTAPDVMKDALQKKFGGPKTALGQVGDFVGGVVNDVVGAVRGTQDPAENDTSVFDPMEANFVGADTDGLAAMNRAGLSRYHRRGFGRCYGQATWWPVCATGKRRQRLSNYRVS